MEVLQLARTGWVGWVQQRGNHRRSRKQLMEELQPFCIQSGVYEAHARGIATGVVEAGHKAEANRVSARQEYNWNGRGCSFCRNAGEVSPTMTATARCTSSSIKAGRRSS